MLLQASNRVLLMIGQTLAHYKILEKLGSGFITMQLVQGRTLTRLISKKALPSNKLFEIAIPLADAVSAAHEQGITS